MPSLPPKYCGRPGCAKLAKPGSKYCDDHRLQIRRQDERHRETAAQRGYGHKWRSAREGYLAKHPLCIECQRQGRSELATVVDHIRPHKGDWSLFWDRDNWQPLCRSCHGIKTAREDGGFGNVR